MTKVLILNTNSVESFVGLTEKGIKNVVPPGVEVELSFPENWTTLVVDEYTKALTVPHILEQAERAKEGGYDAVVVNCHCDPGIEPLREMLDIPVVGLGETSILLASHLAERFSMVTVTNSMARMDRQLARKLDVESKLASIRTFGDMSTVSREGGDLFSGDRDKYRRFLVEQCRLAVVEDGARAVYLAGSVFEYLIPGLVEELGEVLRREGYGSIPIIEPMRAALGMAQLLTDLKVKHRL